MGDGFQGPCLASKGTSLMTDNLVLLHRDLQKDMACWREIICNGVVFVVF